jgi:hypothetical protein
MALSALVTGTLTVLLGLLVFRSRPREPQGPAVSRVAAQFTVSPRAVSDPEPLAERAATIAAPPLAPTATPPRPGVATTRPRPPRLRVAPARPARAVVDFLALLRAQPAVASAISQTATENRERYMPALRECAESLAARRPGSIVDGELKGAVALILEIRAGQMRLVDVVPHRECDARFTRCYQQALDYGDLIMDVAGTPDGTVAVEWTYRFGMKP